MPTQPLCRERRVTTHLAELEVARAQDTLARIDAGQPLPGQQPSQDPLAYQLGFLKGQLQSMADLITRVLERPLSTNEAMLDGLVGDLGVGP